MSYICGITRMAYVHDVLGGYIGVLAGVAAVSLQQGKNREYFILAYAIGSTILILAIVDALVKFGDSNAYRIISGFFGGIGFGCMLAASALLRFGEKLMLKKSAGFCFFTIFRRSECER